MMTLSTRTPPTAEEFLAYKERFKNWGRWGADDEFGTLNFITSDVRLAAARLVTEGSSVGCGNPLAITPGPRNPNPAQHFMRFGPTGSSDYIGVSYHGMINTHIDALCHIWTGEWGEMWNGRPSSDVTPAGSKSNSVDHWRQGIVTRGVLYDVPRFRGAPYVEVGHPVHGWELADIAQTQGVEPRTGDAVLVRSGYDPYFEANPNQGFGFPRSTPGVHASALEFLYETNAALLGWDLQEAGGQQDYPARIAIHEVAIPYMGLPLLDNATFEALAAKCAEVGRWEFMLVVAPLVVVGGTGSPVNPIAVF
jgi:kynurenine formamidase